VKLREALTPRGLAAWAGTDRLSALAFHLPSGPHVTPAAKLFALFVCGDTIRIDGDFGDLIVDDKARCSILPLGRSLLVCDRLDADGGTDLVCWPDDSSYHLARSIPPGRRARWLDIATGSGFSPLLRPELAESIVGAEINPRAIEYAKAGVELSGLTERISIVQADLTAGIDGAFDLVTCNAPIPADVGPRWRATADNTFFARLFAEVPRVLAPSGLFVLHAALDAIAPIVGTLPGDRVTVSYVPDGGRQFGILWWQPDALARDVRGRRALTPAQPHLTHADRASALG
jgi:SAM-dependent methyltransferase